MWNSYRFAEKQREKFYVLDNGKSLMLALSQDLSQNRPAEAREHEMCIRDRRIAAHEEVPAEKADIVGKSSFRMASTRTTAAIPTQEAATMEKGIELSEEAATFDDGKTGNASRPAQVPEEKLDETFTSIPPEELGYGDEMCIRDRYHAVLPFE